MAGDKTVIPRRLVQSETRPEPRQEPFVESIPAHNPPAGASRRRGVHRHDDRVVRLLHLRDRRRARVRRAVLPVARSVREHDGVVRHLRGRLLRAAVGRPDLRPSRRQDRPQESADDHADDDGRRDRVRRPAAELHEGRPARAGAARAAARGAGHRGRRRVGRRGADGGRTCAGRPPHVLRVVRAARQSGRPDPVAGRVPRGDVDGPRRLHRVGLAPAVSGERGAARRSASSSGSA